MRVLSAVSESEWIIDFVHQQLQSTAWREELPVLLRGHAFVVDAE